MDLKSLFQKDIIEIAKNDDNDLEKRFAAIDNIDDEDIVIDIAKNDYFWSIRQRAVSNIENKEILKEISLNDPNDEVKFTALKTIGDEKILENLISAPQLLRLKSRIIPLIEDLDFLVEYASVNVDDEILDDVLTHIDDLSHRTIIKIVFHHSNLDLRIAACGYINNDYGLLDSLIFSDAPTDLKIEAVNRSDDECLREVILSHDDLEVVKAAIHKIDSSWLNVIVVECENNLARREMVKLIYNPFVLNELALSDEDECVRYNAMYRIYDEETAYHVAMNDENRYVREMATLKVWDEDLLYDIVIKDLEVVISNESDYDDLYGISKALSAFVMEHIQLEDNNLEVMYRFHDDNVAVKTLRFFDFRDALINVIGKLSDKSVLKRITFDGDINGIEAIDEIADESLLTKIVISSKIPQISKRAFKNIKNELNLSYIACNCNVWQLRRQAIKKITNESILADICCNSKYEDMVFAAMSKIRDEETLIHVVYNTSNDEIRQYATSKIKNKTVLKDIRNSK